GTGSGAGTASGAASRTGRSAPDGQEPPAGAALMPAPRDGDRPPVDSTVAIRALRAARRAKDEEAASGRPGASEGTMAIRALSQGAAGARALPPPPTRPKPQLPGRVEPITAPSPQPQAQPQAQPQTQQPPRIQQPQQPQRPQPPESPVPSAGVPNTVISSGAGGGAASWAQQPLPRDGGDQAVLPWKPPADDPFLRHAQAQAAARPAGLGRRFAARLIDSVVLGAVVGAVAVPLAGRALTHVDDKVEAARQTGQTVTVWLLDATTGAYLGAVLAALLVVGALYEALPTARWGRTLGKKLCGLEVRDIETHEPPPFGAALRRWLVYSVLGVLAVGVLNVLWCLFDRPWRQCWHDKTAHTFVAGSR
ncbi:RDD family protein, partial [Streptomyces hebeiensis]|uniref:RDD family protein n=1 Tax=Streptomyces hebeiensis TaxID=229486 RepID=UPI0031E1C761